MFKKNKFFIGIGLVLILLVLVGLSVFKIQDTTSFAKTVKKLPEIIRPVEKSIKIFAVGDMMLDRNVEALAIKYGDQYIYEFFNTFNVNQDVVLANLEGPIKEVRQRILTGSMNFSFDPKVAGLLRNAGFTHVSISNNHTYDKGAEAFIETQQHLSAAGLKYFGHPQKATKEFVLIEEINEIPIIWVGLNEAVSKFYDIEESNKLIADLHTEYPDHNIIVYIHWGLEYKPVSWKRQQDIAHGLIDNGAEIVIGSHPHVVQEIEKYNDKLIFYSLGNFIFDQYFSKETQEGLGVYLKLTEKGDLFVDLIGIKIDRSRPGRMSFEDEQIFLNELAERSSESLKNDVKTGHLEIMNNEK